MSCVNAAWDALYTCTRYPGLTARVVVGSGRAMDALPHSDLAANTAIRWDVQDGNACVPHSRTHRTRCFMSRVNAAWDALLG